MCALAVTPITWEDNEKYKVHKGIGSCATNLHRRLRRITRVFSDSGHDIVLVGHSLGAGAAALLAWRLKRDGCKSVAAFAFACPPCASLELARECSDVVTSCVMRDDAVPRAVPRAMVVMERTLMGLEWDHMRESAQEWGVFGKWVLENAECASTCRACTFCLEHNAELRTL
jgi:pimeloyl-ACP methyl ester carboxylesterase